MRIGSSRTTVRGIGMTPSVRLGFSKVRRVTGDSLLVVQDFRMVAEENGMDRKKKVAIGPGQEVDATEVGYRTAGEFWNEYLADDGSVIRVKLVVTDISRVDGIYDPQGQPVYFVQSSNVVAVSAPENLKRKS